MEEMGRLPFGRRFNGIVKFASEIRKDRNFMTSHSISRVVPPPRRFHGPLTQVATVKQGGEGKGASKRERTISHLHIFVLRQKSTLRRFAVGAENFIYGTTLLIYELRSDHAEDA